MHKLGITWAGLLCCVAAIAQTPAPPAFEVASVKPAQPLMNQVTSGKMHIGMTIDAARVDIGSLSLAELIPAAFRVKSYQIKGPDWLSTNRFDIVATIPEGVSKEKVPEMLQALLTERFGLTFHKENREIPVYALVVGKDGAKLKPADPDAPGTAPPSDSPLGGVMINGRGDLPRPMAGAGRGMSIAAPGMGATKMTMGPDGNMHMEAGRVSMTTFAEMISRFVDKPVIDATGLTGFYQVALDLAMGDLIRVAQSSGVMPPGGVPAGMMPGGRAGVPSPDTASDPSGGAIFASVQKLGLKLDGRKSPVETIVVDHLEKNPTEN